VERVIVTIKTSWTCSKLRTWTLVGTSASIVLTGRVEARPARPALISQSSPTRKASLLPPVHLPASPLHPPRTYPTPLIRSTRAPSPPRSRLLSPLSPLPHLLRRRSQSSISSLPLTPLMRQSPKALLRLLPSSVGPQPSEPAWPAPLRRRQRPSPRPSRRHRLFPPLRRLRRLRCPWPLLPRPRRRPRRRRISPARFSPQGVPRPGVQQASFPQSRTRRCRTLLKRSQTDRKGKGMLRRRVHMILVCGLKCHVQSPRSRLAHLHRHFQAQSRGSRVGPLSSSGLARREASAGGCRILDWQACGHDSHLLCLRSGQDQRCAPSRCPLCILPS
jgi:hypothetical protein